MLLVAISLKKHNNKKTTTKKNKPKKPPNDITTCEKVTTKRQDKTSTRFQFLFPAQSNTLHHLSQAIIRPLTIHGIKGHNIKIQKNQTAETCSLSNNQQVETPVVPTALQVT